jgi:hypothetical protein
MLILRSGRDIILRERVSRKCVAPMARAFDILAELPLGDMPDRGCYAPKARTTRKRR